MEKLIIAVDGPAGVGKSTVAKLLADKLNLTYIDTGAMYRAIALSALKKALNPNYHVGEICEIAETAEFKFEDNSKRIFLNGIEVTGEIRTPEVSKLASEVSVFKEVREALVKAQRNMTKLDLNNTSSNNKGFIMDGRDVGTVVFPNAQIKIFMVASPEIRAKRRYDELVQKGIEQEFEQVLKDVKERDLADSTREISPLRKAEDALLLNTDNKSLEEVFQEALSLILKT